MANENTPKFNLLIVDPIANPDDTFNIDSMLNDNWRKMEKATKGAPLTLDGATLNEEEESGHKHALSIASKAEAEAGTDNKKLVTPLRVKQAILANIPSKEDIGLGNVDNTSDANKPVSTAQQAALNEKANLASPALSGTPTAPTATTATNNTQLATTAFVRGQTLRGTGVNVTSASWVASGNAEYPFRKDALIAGVVAADYPTLVAFNAATIAIANAANIGYVECYAGGIRLFAKTAPTGTVTFDYVITKA